MKVVIPAIVLGGTNGATYIRPMFNFKPRSSTSAARYYTFLVTIKGLSQWDALAALSTAYPEETGAIL